MSTINKVIHYCWFGRNPLPKSAIKCINSWKKYLPDYDIKEWNEDNFDVNIIPYTQEAYAAKKYAFVSDYARFWILYKFGGLYFDTDVEVIKSFETIVNKGPFMGIEVETSNEYNAPLVAPGLGIGVTPGHVLYKEILNYYDSLHFLDENGKFNKVTVVKHTTKVLIEHGLKNTNEIQNVSGVWIYPKEYFNPFDDSIGRLSITPHTYSIHWYSKTWCDTNSTFTKISRLSHRLFGTKITTKIHFLIEALLFTKK